MSKLRRFEEAGAGYFVTTVSHGRRSIFQETEAVELLLGELRTYKEELSFRVYGYVIMPDHVHLILHPISVAGLSEIMKRVKGRFARRYNKNIRGIGTVWRHSFFDRGLRDESALGMQIDYMHENPVRKGLAASPADYAFSSARAYLFEFDDGVTDRYSA